MSGLSNGLIFFFAFPGDLLAPLVWHWLLYRSVGQVGLRGLLFGHFVCETLLLLGRVVVHLVSNLLLNILENGAVHELGKRVQLLLVK